MEMYDGHATLKAAQTRLFGSALLSMMTDFTDEVKQAGEPAKSECSG